jgi:hypothetical protein
MEKIKDSDVANIFKTYPVHMRKRLMYLRQLIYETASEIECIDNVEECIKWGEPSYMAKGGSTIRVGWKKSKPEQYAIYFNCKTNLVDTFKELYGEKFKTEGNRAIIFDEADGIAVEELKHCIMLSLTYHSRKKRQK